MRLVLGLLLAARAFATTTIAPFGPYDISATQAVIHYTTDQTASTCVVRASEGGTLGTMVNDVNTSLFSGSNAATRTGAVAGSYFVLGTRGYYLASDGKYYSRALRNRTAHIAGVQCGSDPEVTVTFTTTNGAFSTPPESFQFDSNLFGNYAQPTILGNLDASYVDAQTGNLMKAQTDDTNSADATANSNRTPDSVIDVASAWTNIGNFTATGASFASHAGSGGTTGAPVFIAFNPSGIFQGYNAGYDGTEALITNYRLNLNGYGDDATSANRVVSACLAAHRTTCTCPASDLAAYGQGSGAAGFQSFPASSWPSVDFASWCANPIWQLGSPQINPHKGTVTVTGGNVVTWNSGNAFLDYQPGDWITITGSGCPNSDQCVISAVDNDTQMHLSSTSSNVSAAAFTSNNFGILIWKKTATGSIFLNNARMDLVTSTNYSVPFGGASSNCSNIPSPVTVDRTGAPLGHSLSGQLCIQEDIFGNIRELWNGIDGSSRFIARLVAPAVTGSSGGKDDNPNLPSGCDISAGVSPESPFDSINAFKLYCVGSGNNTGGTGPSGIYSVVRSFTYLWGNPGCDLREWAVTYDVSVDNPCMQVVNLTKASLNQDLGSQAVALVPTFNTSYFGTWTSPGPAGNTQMPLTAKAGQNSIGWYARLDMTMTPPTIVQMVSSYNTYPTKYAEIHGAADQPNDGYGRLYLSPLSTPSTFSISAIQGLGSTALTNSYVDASTCQALGVTNTTFIAEGATGLNCIVVDNPSAVSWTMADGTVVVPEEGDFFIDSAGTQGLGEILRLVKKLTATRWVVQRGVQYDCGNLGKTAHSNGWTPIMWIAHNCSSAVFHWFANNGTILPDNAVINEGHHDLMVPISTSTYIYSQAGDYAGTGGGTGYTQRIGGLPGMINQPASYATNVKQYDPCFNASTACLAATQIQSHQSGRQVTASANERRWFTDGRPLGGSGGGAAHLGYQAVVPCATVNACTGSNAAAANVYKVGNMTESPGGGGATFSTLDRKNVPVIAWAGRYLLKDISGPGSSISAAANFSFCVADFAGECIAGSSAGNVFEKVPQANTGGDCLGSMDANTLCWVSTQHAPSITQYGVDVPDPTGVYWRKVSTFFNGPSWTNNYWNARATPTASFISTVSRWTNGVSNRIMAAVVPPWPTITDTTGNAYVPYLVPVTGNAQPNARVRFGYAENGSPTSYYCMTRQEACVTDAVWDGTTATTPFKWSSETQTLQSCSPSCTIKVPVMIGRMVQMVGEYVDSMGNTTGTFALAPVTVPFIDSGSTGGSVFGGSSVRGGKTASQ